MGNIINIYCDESCHLENDGQKVMVLGGVWNSKDKSHEIAVRIREIKEKHGLSKNFEIKWTKVSPAKITFYLELIDFFFDDSDLHFRALVIPDKTILEHEDFEQTHDEWYYKMYYDMLKEILYPDSHYRIFVDIKDTQGGQKIITLHNVLCNDKLDFEKNIVGRVQQVRSHEVEQLQLADLLIGAVKYANGDIFTSEAKSAIVTRIRQRSGYSLIRSTLLREEKCNILVWQPRGQV